MKIIRRYLPIFRSFVRTFFFRWILFFYIIICISTLPIHTYLYNLHKRDVYSSEDEHFSSYRYVYFKVANEILFKKKKGRNARRSIPTLYFMLETFLTLL